MAFICASEDKAGKELKRCHSGLRRVFVTQPADAATSRWATVFVLTVPLFFSGIVFSTAIRMTRNISGIMAANLLGAMLGGLLEYNSMKFGFQALYVLGIAVYGLAAASYLISHRVRTA